MVFVLFCMVGFDGLVCLGWGLFWVAVVCFGWLLFMIVELVFMFYVLVFVVSVGVRLLFWCCFMRYLVLSLLLGCCVLCVCLVGYWWGFGWLVVLWVFGLFVFVWVGWGLGWFRMVVCYA